MLLVKGEERPLRLSRGSGEGLGAFRDMALGLRAPFSPQVSSHIPDLHLQFSGWTL